MASVYYLRALLLQRKSMLCTGYQCCVRVALFWQSWVK
ncbi:hypothetical protein SOVF_065890, partial [Spinacia oleracea]